MLVTSVMSHPQGCPPEKGKEKGKQLRCDGSDGRVAASYLEDPGSNPAVSGSIFDQLLSLTCIDGYVASNKCCQLLSISF